MHQIPFAFFGIGGIGPMELLIVGFIALLLFGKRLPDVARSLGSSLTQFKKGLNDPADDNPSYGSNSSASRPLPKEEQPVRQD